MTCAVGRMDNVASIRGIKYLKIYLICSDFMV